MKKNRILANILVIILLLGTYSAPVLGVSNIKINNNATTSLTLNNLKSKLIENNRDLKLLGYGFDKLSLDLVDYKDKTYDATNSYIKVRDGVGDLESGKSFLLYQIRSLKHQRDELTQPINEAELAEYLAEITELNTQINNLEKQVSQLDAQISSMESSSSGLIDSLNSLRSAQASLTYNKTAIEKNNSITMEKLLHSAEVIYYQLLNLDFDIEKLELQIKLLDSAYQSEKRMIELGLSFKENLSNSENNLDTSLNSLESLKAQRENLMNQLKILLGYPLSTNLNLSHMKFKEIILPEYKQGLALALKNGEEIKYNQLLLDNQELYLTQLKKEFGGTKTQLSKQELVIKEAQVNLEKANANTENAYYNNYANFAHLKENFKLSENQLALTKRTYEKQLNQYNLGLISKVALNSSESDYLLQELTFKQKQYDYEIAKSKYYMASKGYLIN